MGDPIDDWLEKIRKALEDKLGETEEGVLDVGGRLDIEIDGVWGALFDIERAFNAKLSALEGTLQAQTDAMASDIYNLRDELSTRLDTVIAESMAYTDNAVKGIGDDITLAVDGLRGEFETQVTDLQDGLGDLSVSLSTGLSTLEADFTERVTALASSVDTTIDGISSDLSVISDTLSDPSILTDLIMNAFDNVW